MAKVSIIFTDTKDGVMIEKEFDPPIKKSATLRDMTDAQLTAAQICDMIAELVDESTEEIDWHKEGLDDIKH